MNPERYLLSKSMSTMLEEVKFLQSKFRYGFQLESHCDTNGKSAPCCEAAHLSIKSSLIASSKSGLSGVLNYLEKKFCWGVVQQQYYCECLSANGLACGAGTAIACLALEIYRDELHHVSISNDRNYSLVSVLMVQHTSAENSKLWRNEVIKKIKNCNSGTSQISPHDWICDNCAYHECVGFINHDTRELSVWDFGSWLRLQSDTSTTGALISVRIAPRFAKVDPVGQGRVVWDGIELELSKWIDVPSEAKPLSNHAQASIISNVYSHKSKTTTDHGLLEPLVVYISGVEMGVNPCAGIGVARAIRAKFPTANLIALDDHFGSAAGGMCDPVFDSALSMELMGNAISQSVWLQCKKFETIVDLLTTNSSAFYIPCRDMDVSAMALGKTSSGDIQTPKTTTEAEKSGLQDDDNIKKFRNVFDRILSPSIVAVAMAEKPNILETSDGALKKCFFIPEYFALNPETSSFVQVQLFSERVGYPLLVKGSSQGCVLCYNWRDVSQCLCSTFSFRGFVQRHIYGNDITIAFAAYQGELTGCIQMIKESSTVAGKVWDGRINPVPKDLEKALANFVKECDWTGGGELEMVRDLSGKLWMIDFNARFPAWIFASSFSGYNLPGEFIEHATLSHVVKMRIEETGALQSEVDTGALQSSEKCKDYYLLPEKREASESARAAFTRSIIEIPRVNVIIDRKMQSQGYSVPNNGPQIKSGKAAVPITIEHFIPTLPRMNTISSEGITTNCDNNGTSQIKQFIDSKVMTSNSGHSNAIAKGLLVIEEDFEKLAAAAMKFLQKGPTITPKRLLCVELVQDSLERHSRMFSTAAKAARSLILSENLLFKTPVPLLKVQLCLSVKTQPHPAVLKAAREANYVAECISIAEVHAALNSKFLIEQIILTGPGKFYDVIPKEATLGNASRGLPGPLRAIFADSLSDLRNIVHRVLDPNDWLDSSMIGVRWIPSWHRASRFGLDPKDPEVVLAAAEIISALPSSKEVGMHFHFASSNVGSETWFSLAHAFCQFCAGFTKLINRHLAAIDFGGGWSPHFFVEDESSNNSKLNILLQSLYINFHSIQIDLPSIQFEPGKCISEAAGGIITRILGIREVSNNSTAENSHTCRAMIVDTCIAEVSSPHIHPIFWRPNRSDGITDAWIPVGPGKDLIWGRTCMEFDQIVGMFTFPAEIKPGDFLLIAATGSYDFTNSYDFGDGIPRDMSLI